jgi:hypothetical protein
MARFETRSGVLELGSLGLFDYDVSDGRRVQGCMENELIKIKKWLSKWMPQGSRAFKFTAGKF